MWTVLLNSIATCIAVPVSWSGVIIGALDLRLSGLLDVRSNDSEDTKGERNERLCAVGVFVCRCKFYTISAQ